MVLTKMFYLCFCRKCEVYAMEWSGVVDLAKHTVAAAAYGGPIGKTARLLFCCQQSKVKNKTIYFFSNYLLNRV